jgi:tRNA(fMet)-specific endonuclease VapC
MRYLLDADTISFMVRRDANVLARLMSTPRTWLVVSSVTLMELEFGMARKPERRAALEAILKPFLDDVSIVPFTPQDAQATAAVRAALALSGQPIGPYDVMLAGMGLCRGLTVVTGNTREFQRVSGLLVEDWRT